MKGNWLFQYILRHKYNLLLVTVLLIVDAICTFYYPSFITNIIDVAVPNSDLQYLSENIILLLIVSLLSLFINLSINYLFYNMSGKFVIFIKSKLIGGVFSFNGKSIKSKTNQFMTCMVDDVYSLESTFSRLISSVLLDIITLAILIVILVKIDIAIFVLIAVMFPLLILIQFLFNKEIQKSSMKMMKEIDLSTSLLRELVTYLYEYVVCNGKTYFKQRFFPVEEEVKQQRINLYMLSEYNSLAPRFLNTIAFTVLLFYSSYRIINSDMSFGDLTIVVLYLNQLSTLFVRILLVAGQLQKTRVSLKRINDVIDEE